MSVSKHLARRLRQARWHRVDDGLSRRTVVCGAAVLPTCALLGCDRDPRGVVIKGSRGVGPKQPSGNPLAGSRSWAGA